MPAATAAATPTTLSSTTVQPAGVAPSWRAASRNRSGAGLPDATWIALNTCGSKKRNNPVNAKPLAHPLEMAVRGDAARRRQRAQQFLDPRHRLQFAFEDDRGLRAHRLEKTVRQRAPVAGLDRGAQGVAVLAKAEQQGLLGRRRKIRRGQALAEDAGKDYFAVDEDAVAIEDDQIGHAAPFIAPPGRKRTALSYRVIAGPLERSWPEYRELARSCGRCSLDCGRARARPIGAAAAGQLRTGCRFRP